MKRFALGTLCVLLAMALGACSEESSPSSPSSPGGRDNPIEWDGEGFLVIFDENGGDTPANPQNKIVLPPETTVDALPEPPTREGHNFLGWNMEADGSGMPFTANTPVSEHLRVYAQWELSSSSGLPQLKVSINPSADILTPIIAGTYSERSTTLGVVVSGFANAAEANNARLSVSVTNGLAFTVESNPSGNTQNFNIVVRYDGETAFPPGVATFSLSLIHIPGYEAETRTTTVNIRDGLAAGERAIPLNEDNILSFNSYARTADGLVRHYRLTGDVNLNTSSTNNWTAIGTSAAPFMGSLNGGGHALYGLRISNSSSHQGLFGYIGEGAVIENLGVTDVNVSAGQYTGGLVGWNSGTVQNCYATGVVSSSSDWSYVGGLVGVNGIAGSRVQNSYATTNVTGRRYTGGLVGHNHGTVEHVYATGLVSATSTLNGGYGSSIAYTSVGGLMGGNNGTLRNSLALNSRVNVSYQNGYRACDSYGNNCNYVSTTECATNEVGRVVGSNTATLLNNAAYSGMLNCSGATLSSSTNANSTQGDNRALSALQVAGGFPEALRTTPWAYQPNHLPGLFGQPVLMPAHIQ
ncbi:MAG: InlB B-repeat-containing protein [Cystobacterineae bacterium]|nr:InlB B-repeat-containing protein [Cystobacterineae bacterium]